MSCIIRFSKPLADKSLEKSFSFPECVKISKNTILVPNTLGMLQSFSNCIPDVFKNRLGELIAMLLYLKTKMFDFACSPRRKKRILYACNKSKSDSYRSFNLRDKTHSIMIIISMRSTIRLK